MIIVSLKRAFIIYKSNKKQSNHIYSRKHHIYKNFFNKIIFENGGRLYPAKDALMKAEEFQKGYKKLDEFKKFVDPKFSSSFWRRVSQ